MTTDRLTSLQDSTDAPTAAAREWTAPALRPVAHWVLMPTTVGQAELIMVWETPNPMLPA